LRVETVESGKKVAPNWEANKGERRGEERTGERLSLYSLFTLHFNVSAGDSSIKKGIFHLSWRQKNGAKKRKP